MTRTIGPYEVVRELGRGGMGAVFEVRDPALPERALALKLLLVDAQDEEALARFRREVELLARVRHKHVVAVHSFGAAREGPYVVMDKVDGRPLRGLELEPRAAAALVRDLCDAVAALHAQGVLHRDLKPANVMLREDGTAVLLDFGLARELHADRLTRTGDILGTPTYMAPEQARGHGHARVDERTDVYGLGTVLFELLGGEPPFAEVEGGPIAVVYAVSERDPRWPGERRAVPPALEAIVRRAMAKQRATRHPSAIALREALDAFLRGEAVAPRSRRALVTALAGAAALVVLLAAALALRPGAVADDRAGPVASSHDAPADRPRRPTIARPPRPSTSTLPRRGPRIALAPRASAPGEPPPDLHVRPLWLDDRRLVVGTELGAEVWDVSEDPPVKRAAVTGFDARCFARDGGRLLVADGEGRLVALGADDLAPLGEPVHVGARWALALALSSGGVLALSHAPAPAEDGAGMEPRRVHVGAWDRLARRDAPGNPRALAFSPDGARLAGASTDGEAGLYLWDLGGGPPRNVFRDVPCTAVAMTDGAIVAGLVTGSIAVFDPTGAFRGLVAERGGVEQGGISRVAVHAGPVHDLAFVGDRLYSVGGERGRVTLLAWDVPGWTPAGALDPVGDARLLAPSPDRRRLAVVEPKRIVVWELGPPVADGR